MDYELKRAEWLAKHGLTEEKIKKINRQNLFVEMGWEKELNNLNQLEFDFKN